MKYYGGKSRLGSRISDFIINFLKKQEEKGKVIDKYLEPFCGSLGVLKHIVLTNKFKKVYACDINKDLIMLYKLLKKERVPDKLWIDKNKYDSLKNSKSSPLRALAGIVYSYGGGWFNGYCPECSGRDYVKEGYDALNNMIPIIQKVKFSYGTYNSLYPKGFVIYCDPPYRDTHKKYQTNGISFDSNEFWTLMRLWSKNNIVFISELVAPSDFKCIWKVEYTSGINKNNSTRIEKLFIHKSLL